MNPRYILIVTIGLLLAIQTRQQNEGEHENERSPFEKMDQNQVDSLIDTLLRHPNEFSILFDGINDGFFIKLIKLMVYLKEESLNSNATSFLYDGKNFDFQEMLEIVAIVNGED